MSVPAVIDAAAPAARPSTPPLSPRVGLLGCGTVGSALVHLLESQPEPGRMRITGALVRDARRGRPLAADVPLTDVPEAILAGRPDVLVELLGGCEPARTLVAQALATGVPVVTANKTLIARCGRELRDVARATGTPLLYEAAVIAGVPFLGTFARRPLAASLTGVTGIVNGTSNYVLTRCGQGLPLEQAVSEAQRQGYAEPDPTNDVAGIDAAEKLAVLLQHFASLHVSPDSIETRGLDALSRTAAEDAAALGGTVRPVVHADWSSGLDAFVGPAFVPSGHLLCDVEGADNALILQSRLGRLLFQGPGAGPSVTAATVLDDVTEVVTGRTPPASPPLADAEAREAETGWMLSLEGRRLPPGIELADYLSSHGIYVRRAADRRTADGLVRQALLTWPARRHSVERALEGICKAAHCTSASVRALEVVR